MRSFRGAERLIQPIQPSSHAGDITQASLLRKRVDLLAQVD